MWKTLTVSRNSAGFYFVLYFSCVVFMWIFFSMDLQSACRIGYRQLPTVVQSFQMITRLDYWLAEKPGH